jgi:UDP-2-acetamido-2-deoxy-ribo-hexuluronate aminotransferase
MSAKVDLLDAETVDFAGLKAQQAVLGDRIAERMAAVIRHGQYIMGPEVAELEGTLAAFVGARHAIAVSSGTDALVAAMMALGVGPGDAVFLPAFTFPATAEAVVLLGATPVFVDVDPRLFNLDPDSLAERAEDVHHRGRLRPRVVLAVDLFGLPADYGRIAGVAGRYGMDVVADAAQSLGGAWGERRVGTLAPVTATSFFPAKPLGCFGDGGALFTDDDELAAILRSIRAHGRGAGKYDIERVGLNARLDTLQAAVLLAKLPTFEGELAARARLAASYDARLGNVVTTPLRPRGSVSAWAQYTILSERRDQLQAGLAARGVPSAVYYPRPMHLQPAYAGFGIGPASLPVSEALCGHVLSLPMHGYMSEAVSERVIAAVHEAMA